MFLGIDIGTSGVKAIVLDERGVLVGQGGAPLTVSRPQLLWSEQAPEHWWSATNAAVQAIAPSLRAGVKAVGLAGQMHGATLLGANDKPLRPGILWNDGRSFAECRALEAAAPRLREITGNLAMPGFTAPKLLWVRQHEPDVFRHVKRVLLPKDYVRLQMTGDAASDMSDSAGTLWLDVRGRRWSEEILAASGLGTEAMPALYEGSEITGRLRREVAALWGMDAVPVVAGGGDNAAGAAGVGVVRDGDGLLSLGTSGVIFIATSEFRAYPAAAVHAFCHCLPGMWHQMSVHLNAASCVDWAARLIGAADAPAFFAQAESAGPGGPEMFLPYLSGERTPHNDPHVRGAFHYLDFETNAPRLAQAVLEGVAFALADGVAALRQAGNKVDRLSVIGGGAKSAYWGRLIASALDTSLIYLKGGEVGPALGAAQLARAAHYGVDAVAYCVAPPVSHEIVPEPALRAQLSEKHQRFRAAYGRITSKDAIA